MNLDKMGENLNMNNIFCGKFGIVIAVRFVFNEISIYFTFGVSGFDISAIKVVETFFLVTVYICFIFAHTVFLLCTAEIKHQSLLLSERVLTDV